MRARVAGQLLGDVIEALAALPGGDFALITQRLISDASATLFHTTAAAQRPIVVLLGGTGTGKSTLTNRLLGGPVPPTAASFRRTFTAGCVAVIRDPLPPQWLGLPHEIVPPAQQPTRGEANVLRIVERDAPLLASCAIVDAPDLDGDRPQHHAIADRAFRWATAIVFVVSPEKYQLPELGPYYRLAQRYGVPSLFVMNKVDDSAIADDFAKQLAERYGQSEAKLYIVPRDDALLAIDPGQSLEALSQAIGSLAVPSDRERGIAHRCFDLASRISDQLLEPLRRRHAAGVAAIAAIRAIGTPGADVDLDPMTRQLRQRMQHRSVLYLIGPQRMLDRLRKTPGVLARLPRSVWDLMRGSQTPEPQNDLPADPQTLPDFGTIVTDQFRVVQSLIADSMTASGASTAGDWRLPGSDAQKIVDEELSALRQWLEQRWNQAPRDTALLNKLLGKVPGYSKLSKYSEAAPYLLAIACAAHSAFFGHLDLIILGGYGLATWLGERLSNEVSNRTRTANRNIDARFADLVAMQITRAIDDVRSQTPTPAMLERLTKLVDRLADESNVEAR